MEQNINQSTTDYKVFKQGAEAKIYRTKLFGKSVIIKERFPKKYRHAKLDDKLTNKRTLQEARMILKCRKVGIKTPVLYLIDTKLNRIFMQEIENGITLREEIDLLLKVDEESQLKELAFEVGKIVSRLHQNDVIHGDLTTSNFIVEKRSEGNVYTVIDFGLSYISNFTEDMGVDLYVLERAFLSTHPKTEWIFELLLASYKSHYTDVNKANGILEKLDEVRLRGRKRVMIG